MPKKSKYEELIGNKYGKFDNISFNSIRAATMQDKRIDGSNDYRNRLKPGAIIFYRTNEDRFGKLQILDYGYNLKIRWVKYNKDASVFSSGDGYTMKGGLEFDMDHGVTARDSKSDGDVLWVQKSKVERYLIPRNDAKIKKIY